MSKGGKEVLDMSTDEESGCVIISGSSNYPNIDGDPIKSEGTIDIHSVPHLINNCDSVNCPDEENNHKEKELLCTKTSNLNISPSKKRSNSASSKERNVQKSVSHIKSNSKSSHSGTNAKHATNTPHSGVSVATRSATRPVNAENGKFSNRLKKAQASSCPVSKETLPNENTKHCDEEDTNSGGSSTTASVRITKVKITVPSAPTFRSNERAEKRREFYSKLEEKHQALEAEQSQNEARTKEEREAALKQLRKSLMFKANPIPSFYNEGPPPKVHLKKQPPTRAKSPKFSRRKSCSDAATITTNGNKTRITSVRMGRNSLGSHTELKEESKVNVAAKKVIATSKDKKPSNLCSKAEPVPVDVPSPVERNKEPSDLCSTAEPVPVDVSPPMERSGEIAVE